jgi:hypothetical protein
MITVDVKHMFCILDLFSKKIKFKQIYQHSPGRSFLAKKHYEVLIRSN